MARITFKDGKVQQHNYDDFPVIRMDESPLVTNTYIVLADPDAKRRRRTRRATVRAGPDQRDLRRDRQTHPGGADRQAA
jgi:CO/xanthine dehydrogenase Mo-binding subunit